MEDPLRSHGVIVGLWSLHDQLLPSVFKVDSDLGSVRPRWIGREGRGGRCCVRLNPMGEGVDRAVSQKNRFIEIGATGFGPVKMDAQRGEARFAAGRTEIRCKLEASK